MKPLGPIGFAAILAAQRRIEDAAIRSPMVRLDPTCVAGERDGHRRPPEIWLKLENLQTIGSFKVRGAANALALADPARLRRGVYTGSAGNMAQGVALAARRLGVPCRVIVPDTAPRAKLDAIRRLGATAVQIPFAEWWGVLQDHGHPDEEGWFVHPVSNPAVIAGNGTIGIEIAEAVPDVRAVVAPYGGGGLACGIAAALRELAPTAAVYAAEVDTAAPFAAALRRDRPVAVDHQRSFVDGIGATRVLDEVWPLARDSLAGSLVVSVDEVRAAIRVLAGRAKVVAEGAGAAAVAAALRGVPGGDGGPVVAVVSGGNIDADLLCAIVQDA